MPLSAEVVVQTVFGGVLWGMPASFRNESVQYRSRYALLVCLIQFRYVGQEAHPALTTLLTPDRLSKLQDVRDAGILQLPS